MPGSQIKEPIAEKHQFLSGGGEMGTLIRAKDWSKTPLGDPETWPQSLRTIVSVLLDNPFGMYIAWGREYTQIYNDGYRPILGTTKHPQALGISTRETFAEIWHIIDTMFEGVMNGVPVGFPDFMLPLNRNGYVETCYFDFAYSPIRRGKGEVGGVLVTVIETTNKKKAKEELKESKNELEFVMEAAQLGTFDYNPSTNKFSCNARLKGWFGLPPDEQIELTDAINAIAESDRERVSNAIKNVLEYSSGGIYDVEYTIVNPVSKKGTMVHAKGRAWFNEEKIAYRLNGTLEDVTEQGLIRKKIEESERSLRLMILQAPVAISILRGTDYKVEIANKYALRLWGRTEEQVLNISIFDSMPELSSQGIKEILDDVTNTGNRFATSEFPLQLLRKETLETVYINFSYEALYDADRKVNGIMAIGFEVTQQIEARKKVEDSETRYNLMLMQSPFAFLILKGKDMVVHLANESMVEVLGKGPDIEGKPLLEVLPELKGQAFPDLLDGVYTTGIPFSANEMLAQLMRDGKLEDVYFNYVYQPYYEADKTISGVTVIAYDVTAAVVANKKIEENEEKLKIVIDASDLGTWESDLITKEVKYSDKSIGLIGYQPGVEIKYEDLIKHIHPDDLIIRNKAYDEALRTGYMHYETRIIWKDQSIHWLDVRGKVFKNDQNRPIKIVGTIRNITEEKLYQQELEEREQKFRTLADFMPQFVWTGDANGNLNYFNQAVYDYSGLTPEQVEKEGWIQIVHSDEREANIQAWTDSVTKGTDFIFEHRFKRADGQYRWQLSRATPQRDANGVIQMWIGTSTDIHDIKEKEQQKDYFISMASHELKTPVTSIKGYIQILKTMYAAKDDGFLINSLNIVDKQIVTLTNLISDLLDISKIKTGGFILNKENFEINELINDIAGEIKHINPDHSIIVAVKQRVMVYADRDRIGQVMINFLTNAVKYAPESKNIKIKSIKQGEQVIVAVEDQGIGISTKDQQRIFERFYRVEGKNEKTFPGFGIGLFISAEIIQRHNGRISVVSEPGKGSVFSFSLPVIK